MNDPAKPVTLYVDLDGTLIYGDLSLEAIFALLLKNPFYVLVLPFWMLRGKAYFKHQVAMRAGCDAENLPYNGEFLKFLKASRQSGRRLVLATASHRRHAEEVAHFLGLFDAVIATDEGCNLDGTRKLEAIRRDCAGQPFAYAGNERKDLILWRQAHAAILVNASAVVATLARRDANVEREFAAAQRGMGNYIQALRPHQWTKNLLLVVPLLTAHQWSNAVSVFQVFVAFISFCLCASGIYVLNDLVDVASDRRHPRKRMRPFASGMVPVPHGMVLAAMLVVAGLWLASRLSHEFICAILLYLAATIGYSFYFKSKLILDVLVLAGLYTLRVIAGAFAIGVALSFWLLAFSIFLFVSLALVKRCVELGMMAGHTKNSASGRGYVMGDLQTLRAMGVASGFVAVMVYALYINSADVTYLYSSPKWLWLTCPAMLYWICRTWINEARGAVHDDPIVYALRDPASYGVLAAVVGTLLIAI